MAVEGHAAGPSPAPEPVPAAPTAAPALAPAAAGRVALAAPGGAINPAAVLALQRTAGNQAVSRLVADRAVLARNGPTAPAATPDFATTLAGGDYDAAVRALDPLDDAAQEARLRVLSSDQLTRLADAARRVLRDQSSRTTHNIERWQIQIGERTRLRAMFEDAVAHSRWDDAVSGLQHGFETPEERLRRLEGLTVEQLRPLRDAVARGGATVADLLVPLDACLAARERARVAQLEADYAAAIGPPSDWVRAATLLNAYNDDDIRGKVDALTPDQRRQMEAGARQATAIGTGDRVLSALRTRTGTRQGQIFGTVTTTGQPQSATTPGGTYAFVFTLTFTPDASVVNAGQIAFVQTSRVTTPGTNTNREYMEPQNSRRNSRQEAIDRMAGNAFGWYGFGNNGQPNPALANIRTGSAPTPLTPAWLYDRPSDNMTNVSFEFETSVIARQGAQADLVYSVVHWGFTADNNGAVTALPVRVEDRPTAGFGEAVTAWNTQAAGPAAGRNAPSQQALPAFR